MIRVQTVAVGRDKPFIRMADEHEFEIVLKPVFDFAGSVLVQPAKNKSNIIL